MSKRWYVKVETNVVFTVGTNIGVVAPDQVKAGIRAQELVCDWINRDDYMAELENALPWELYLGGEEWNRGSRSGEIDFDSMRSVFVEPDPNFDPEGDDDEVQEDAAVVRDLMEAAQCLNESFHCLPEDHPLRDYQHRYGIAEVRDQLNLCAIYCDNLYRYMMSEQGYDNCFDFNFVPQFLENCVDHETFKPKSTDMRVLFLYFNGATKKEYGSD